jgi:hypothetical protein
MNSAIRFAQMTLAACAAVTATGLTPTRAQVGPIAPSQPGTQFAAPLGIDWKQASNDNGSAGIGNVVWIGSILQQNNSIYYEGMSVPQRLIFVDIPATAGNTHTLTFSVDSTKAGVHAYDFLTSWQQAFDSANAVAPGQNLMQQLFVNQCGANIGPQASTALCDALHNGGNIAFADAPDNMGAVGGPNCGTTPDNVSSRVTAYEVVFGNRTVKLYGNSPFTGTPTLTFNGYSQVCGDSHANYTLAWTSASTNLLVEMAGRLAVGGVAGFTDPLAYGVGFGASNISGGPYHFKLNLLDGSSIGSQDNQIKGADILIPAPQGCSIGIPGETCTGTQVMFTVTPTPVVPGLSYSWALINNTSGATFCSVTNLQTVCVNSGTTAGAFTIRSTISNSSGSAMCDTTYTVGGNTAATALSPVTICEGLTNQFCTTASGAGRSD